METQTTSIVARIAELKQRYTRLALQCRAAGIRVSPETVVKYAKEILTLEAQITKI